MSTESTTAQLIAEGVLCESCKVFIDDDDWSGAEQCSRLYPRLCAKCGGRQREDGQVQILIESEVSKRTAQAEKASAEGDNRVRIQKI